jgi:hypothetical protein
MTPRSFLATVVLLLLSACGPAKAELGQIVSIDLPGGTGPQRLTLHLANAPEAGDRIQLLLGSTRIGVARLTPGGARITSESAQSSGFAWIESNIEPPIGSNDGGRVLSFEFQRAAPAGDYVLELSPEPGSPAAKVEAQFVSDRNEYAATMPVLKGFVKAGPINAGAGGATLELTVERDEEVACIDIVVSDGSAVVAIRLPDGRSVRKDGPPLPGVEWRTVKDRSDFDSPGSMFRLAGLLLRDEGWHHVVFFEKAARGRYQIEVAGATRLSAAFIPMGSLFTDPAPPATSGEVGLQVYAMPFDASVGDAIPLQVGFTGDPIAPQVGFDVSLEYTTVTPGQKREAPSPAPIVERAPVAMTRTPDGRWHGVVVPQRAGLLRVGVSATGTRANGTPFAANGTVHGPNVHRVVARFVSLTEAAVDANANGALDRLDVTARLDVVVPGLYAMDVLLMDRAGHGESITGEHTLNAGAQTLVVSVPASTLRARLEDGPWTISFIRIFRPEGNRFGDFVRVPPDLTVQTSAYRRDQWER